MKSGIRTFAFTIAVDDALVERAGGPGTAPTAFRVWANGVNMSDDGPIIFTEKSAKSLIEEQAARGRLYSSDFDHLSLKENRPAESGRASGWHRLEVRKDAAGEPELWAVDIEWCADAKAGLEEQPPRWRYFSPAFATSKSGEVTSYMNFALCINPLTHNLPSLASATAPTTETAMKTKAEMKAAYEKMNAEGTSEEEKKECAKMLADFFGEEEEDKGGEGEKPKEEKPKETAANNGEGDNKGVGDTSKETAAEGEEKTEAKAAAAMANELLQTKNRLAALEIKNLLDERKDLPDSLRTWCMSQPLDTVKSFLKTAPKQMAARPDRPTQGGGSGGGRIGLQGKELEEVNRGMGIRPEVTSTFDLLEDGRLRINTVKPSDWRRLHKETEQRLAAMKAGTLSFG